MSDAMPTRQELVDLKTNILFLNNWFSSQETMIQTPKGDQINTFNALKVILQQSTNFQIDSSKVNYGKQTQADVNKNLLDAIKDYVTNNNVEDLLTSLVKGKNFVTLSAMNTALKSLSKQLSSDILVVKTYVDLGNIDTVTDKQAVIIASPGISGIFLYIKNSSQEHDGGCVIKDSKERIWVRADQSGGSPKWFGAYGDQANDDTNAVAAYFNAGYSHLNYRYMVTDPKLISQLESMTGEGGLVYNGDFFPAGEITNPITLRVPSISFPTIQDALNWLEGKRFSHNGNVTIQVSDGSYTLNQAITSNVDQWNKVKILGNVTNPSNCQLTVDLSVCLSAFIFKHGFGCSLLDGFLLNVKGHVDSETKGILAQGMSQLTVGDNIILDGFDVGMRAELGSIIRSAKVLSISKNNTTGITIKNCKQACLQTVDSGQIKLTDPLLITASGLSNSGGYAAESNNGIIDIPNADIRNCRVAAYAINSGTVSVKHSKISDCKYAGIAINSGVIVFGEDPTDTNATEIINCEMHGLYSHTRGSITAQAVKVVASGDTGALAEMGGSIDLTNAIISGSKKYGIYSKTLGVITVKDTLSELNGRDGVKADFAGTIIGDMVTSKDNKGYGIHATNAGTINLSGYVTSGNVIDISPMPSSLNPYAASNNGSYILLRL